VKPYPEYRESGVEWIGEIPGHWNTQNAKFLFNRKRKPPREGDGVVTAFRDGEVTLRSNRRAEGFTFSIKEIGYQSIDSGDPYVPAKLSGFL